MWVTAETGFLIDYLFSLEYLHKIPFIDYRPYLEMAVFELLKFIYHFCKSSKDESQNYENMELYWFVHCMREYWYDFRMCIDIAFEDIGTVIKFSIMYPTLNWLKIFERCMPLKLKKKTCFFWVFFHNEKAAAALNDLGYLCSAPFVTKSFVLIFICFVTVHVIYFSVKINEVHQ